MSMFIIDILVLSPYFLVSTLVPIEAQQVIPFSDWRSIGTVTNDRTYEPARQSSRFLPHYVCGGDFVLISLPTYIGSPGWMEGHNYPPNLSCHWNLHAPANSSASTGIKIRILHMQLEDDASFLKDYRSATYFSAHWK